MTDKEKFCKEVTVICDTREQANKHILSYFDTHGIKYEAKKLDFGDYSFRIADKDFSMQCVVERKANVNELWTNISRDRERFEKEVNAMSCITRSPNLIIECCPDRDSLMNFKVNQYAMQVQNRRVEDIGKYIYSTLQSWSSSNRYSLNVHYMNGNNGTASLMLNIFYYYWHNYKELVKPLRSK